MAFRKSEKQQVFIALFTLLGMPFKCAIDGAGVQVRDEIECLIKRS